MAVLLWQLAGRVPSTDSTRSVDDNQGLIRYLRDQCLHPVNRKQLAAALGLSPGYLGRKVKRATGMTFPDFINSLRMEQAMWLLSHSDLSVEEVALRSGYTSANYFAQAFRKA